MRRGAESMFPSILLRGMAAMAVVGAGGCTVGPDYRPSPPHVSTTWSFAPENGLTSIAAADSAWWTAVQDAELDSLIQRAARSNPGLRAPEARLRQARAVRQMSAADFWPTLDASGSFA